MRTVSPLHLSERLAAVAASVSAELEAQLMTRKRPDRLMAAMRHAVFAGGKRMRPFLVIESARLFGVEGASPLRVAAALEAVHCYSLVHDDLPAMDDDSLRRGQPTTHIAYDEATAILAGDGLLTLAFAILADRATCPRANVRAKLVAMLADASGVDGMVGGQMLDLAAEGRFLAKGEKRVKPKAATIRHIQALKTGALIRFAVEAGGVLAPRANRIETRALTVYGKALGLAFQIKDDLLDVEGNAAEVGKGVAKDAAAGKATFVGLLGVEGARAELARVQDEASTALASAFGAEAGMLIALLDYNQARIK